MSIIRAIWLPTSLATSCAVVGIGLSGPFLIPAAAGFLLFACDARGRLKDYEFLSSTPVNLAKYWRPLQRTACGRQVMIAADPFAAKYYCVLGYRWYHILPDNSFRKNSPFLQKKFWTNLIKGIR